MSLINSRHLFRLIGEITLPGFSMQCVEFEDSAPTNLGEDFSTGELILKPATSLVSLQLKLQESSS